MAYEYRIGKMEARRAGPDKLEFKINSEKATVFTSDMAALLMTELPKDEARKLISDIEERMITKGKARIILKAQKDIKKGEDICATIDISKYMDSQGKPSGIRVTKSGIIF